MSEENIEAQHWIGDWNRDVKWHQDILIEEFEKDMYLD